jgi:hypothetical protein
MPAFFSPSKQYRYADAIAPSFFESRQTAEPRDLLVGDGVAAAVTIVDVTKRRILVVDVGAKNSVPAEVNRRATEARIAATQPLIMSMNVREIQKFKHSFLRKLGPDYVELSGGQNCLPAAQNHAHAVEVLTIEAG